MGLFADILNKMLTILNKMLTICDQAKTEQRKIIETLQSQDTAVGGPDHRDDYVYVQGLLENATAEGLIDHSLDSVHCVVHTKLPCTPLVCKIDEEDGHVIIPSGCVAAGNNAGTVEARVRTMKESLSAGAQVLVFHREDHVNAECKENLDENRRIHPTNLREQRAEGAIDPKATGATYYINRGAEACFFSIGTTQASVKAGGVTIWASEYTAQAADANMARDRLQYLEEELGKVGLDLKGALGIPPVLQDAVALPARQCGLDGAFNSAP